MYSTTKQCTNDCSEVDYDNFEYQSEKTYEEDFVAFDQWIDGNFSNQHSFGVACTDIMRQKQVNVKGNDNGDTSHQHCNTHE